MAPKRKAAAAKSVKGNDSGAKSSSKRPKKATKKVVEPVDTEDDIEVKTFVASGEGTPVDSLCVEKVGKACVYVEDGVAWSAMLNQTNIQFNNNKFYLLQLLEDTDGKNYSVWLRWGRVGKNGQSKLTSFNANIHGAKTFFETKFSDKTVNEWENKDNFFKIPGKYDLVEIDFKPNQPTFRAEAAEVENLKIKESELDAKVQELMKLICNIKMMEDTVLEMKYDSKKAPLGKLTEDQINAGYTALKDIERLIKKKEVDHKKFLEASNRFYTKIPHNFGMKAPPIIKTDGEIIEKMQLLQVLSDIEVAMKILIDNKDSFENPIDRHYKCLNCDLSVLNRDDEMFKTIESYLLQSHGKTHNMYKLKVLNIFNCKREIEDKQFSKLANRMLLWHGSRMTNIAGILQQGLRIAPPEAPCTGYMFGKGVYFADRSSKSANYCFATRNSNVGILFLCEVALGNIFELKEADSDSHKKLPKKYNSVKGLGGTVPDSANFKTLPEGTVIPMGKGIALKDAKDLGLIYNEYVVYDTRQIKLRYVVMVQFDFK